jgi:hypothetical protein
MVRSTSTELWQPYPTLGIVIVRSLYILYILTVLVLDLVLVLQ